MLEEMSGLGLSFFLFFFVRWVLRLRFFLDGYAVGFYSFCRPFSFPGCSLLIRCRMRDWCELCGCHNLACILSVLVNGDDSLLSPYCHVRTYISGRIDISYMIKASLTDNPS